MLEICNPLYEKRGSSLGYQSLMQQSLHNLRLDCKCLFSLLVVSAQDMDVQLPAAKDCHCDPAEKRGKQSQGLRMQIASSFHSSQ